MQQIQKLAERATRASYWGEIEDLVIMNMRTQSDKNKLNEDEWKLICQAVNSQSSNERTWKQVKYRWLRHLDPSIVKTPFTKEEMRRVIAAQNKLGNKWTDISQLLPGRTYWQIKNLWFMKLRKLVDDNAEISDKTLGAIPDDYVLKCGDFQPTHEQNKKRMSDQSFASVSMTLEASKSVSLTGSAGNKSKAKNEPKREEKMRILIPKSAKRKRKHLNLLTNIISIPLLYSNEGNRDIDISNENDSFVGVSPIRIVSKSSSILKENRRINGNTVSNFVDDDNDFSKLFDDCANTSHSNVVGEFDNSLSKSYDIFEGNDYLPAYELPKIE